MLLPGVLAPSPRSRETAVLIQYSLATPWLRFLHAIIAESRATLVCVCIYNPPATTIPACLQHERVQVIDWTSNVSGYESVEGRIEMENLMEEVQCAIENATPGPVVLVIDSADTLREDIGSTPKAYNLLKTWHSAIASRPAPSRIVLPIPFRSPLLPLLLTPAYAPSLVHLTLHPPVLLHHLSTAYLTLPPPHSPPSKFWPLFSGLAERGEAERLVWGVDGAGWGDEVVIEVVMRHAGGKRSVERVLEGWKRAGAYELAQLDELKGVWGRGTANEQPAMASDPTRDLPFNLSLTETQQRSRAQVPLPYAHEGQPASSNLNTGAILYEPDAADDIDDDDPDEDLDI